MRGPSKSISLVRHAARTWRGAQSAFAGLVSPLGGWWLSNVEGCRDARRLTQGLVLVLPGIEGRSPFNLSIARGINDAGIGAATIVHDWTTGFWPMFLFNLRASQRNRRQAEAVARVIVEYQDAFPGRPVHLIGHSGGGAIAVWA